METRIEQALIDGGLRRSPGFPDASLAQQMCERWAGSREGKEPLPEALFAQPLGRNHAAIVRTQACGCRVLAVPLTLYRALEGDLFALDAAFPPDWGAKELPALEWTTGPLPPRTVRDLERVLNTTADRSATLLGGVQALLDGGRIVFERPVPDPGLIRDLWALLPGSTRAETWPATFVPSNGLGFHVAVAASAAGPDYSDYVREEGAAEYPEGRYELALQSAVESGDQEEVDRLLSRRSRTQVLWLAVILLLLFTLAAMMAALARPVEGDAQKPTATKKEK